MYVTPRLYLLLWVLLLVWFSLATVAGAGTIGFPVPRQKPLHLRFELVGDSFKEQLNGIEDAEATTGRALVTTAIGLTSWSEVDARVGMAEFNVHEALFNGGFGFAFGGGIRVRLWQSPLGEVGLLGQYLRFTSDDSDSVGIRVEGKWEEFDAGFGVGTKRFGAFQFYAGGVYHRVDITLKPENGSHRNLESEIPSRIFFGIHIYPLIDFPRGEFLVTIEARFIGETPQFTLGAQYQF
jgi:hypothetical protein